MVWFPADDEKPASYRCVLVQIERSADGQAPGLAVGYWKYKGEGELNMWVVPGARAGFVVSHWCDCLGDDFRAPMWPGTQPQGPLDNRLHPAAAQA